MVHNPITMQTKNTKSLYKLYSKDVENKLWYAHRIRVDSETFYKKKKKTLSHMNTDKNKKSY